ncbi:MAG TPA: hypothetical protein PKM54_10935, partial [Anaerolineales bacterium]|nr:hypothetical protein [Anaerolineales bacterium]
VESEGYDEEKLKGSTFHILLPTRTEATDPLITKFFGAPGQLKSESEKETIGKETPPTNNPTS